jgi:multiple sugar transport system permease protein
VVLIAAGITMVAPMLYMVSTSLKKPGLEMVYPPQWIPNPVWWQNYGRIFEITPFSLYIRNTVMIAVVATFGAVFSASLAAFAFARLPFPGSNVLFWLTIMTMMIPAQVTLIPTFLGFRMLGWIGTYLPLLIPPFFGGGAFAIFMLRQFFLTIPQELIDAAEIDGASPPRIYWSIFLPLCKPALATLTVLMFMWRWNDLLGPLVFLRKRDMYTIPVGLAFLTGVGYTVKGQWSVMMAGAVMSIVPILVIFISAQKYFVQAMVTSGLKG